MLANRGRPRLNAFADTLLQGAFRRKSKLRGILGRSLAPHLLRESSARQASGELRNNL
jgi:hypothetical protein